MSVDRTRLTQVLGVPELSWFVARLRRRLEDGGGLGGRVTLRSPTPAQRAATDRLLGRRPSRGASLGLDPPQVEEILRDAGVCDDLTQAVIALSGPIRDRPAEREREERAWRELHEELANALAERPEQAAQGESADQVAAGDSIGTVDSAGPVALTAWWDRVRASGYLKRLAEGNLDAARVLVTQARSVLDRLPASAVRLAVLAADATGDPHALDPDTALGSLLVRAAASLGGVGVPQDAKDRRDAWASVGVLLDGLSAPALVLNVCAEPDTLTGRLLSQHAKGGEPCRVSVRQILRTPPRFSRQGTGPLVFVCENPSVVDAAADRLGSKCAPLVCTEGQPSTAVRLLLQRLTAAGIQLVVHADFDWSGLRIANLIARRHGALPWRFGAIDYARALAELPTQSQGGAALKGNPAVLDSDAALAPAMRASQRTVPEERVLEDLLGDLASVQ